MKLLRSKEETVVVVSDEDEELDWSFGASGRKRLQPREREGGSCSQNPRAN